MHPGLVDLALQAGIAGAELRAGFTGRDRGECVLCRPGAQRRFDFLQAVIFAPLQLPTRDPGLV